MASQKVTILAVGGTLGGEIWNQAQRWSDMRTTVDPNEWDPEQWPWPVREQIDQLAESLLTEAFTPPVLYWSQHVDLWSMGDVFQRPMAIGSAESTYLLTNRFELYCRHIHGGEKVPRNVNIADEYRWLESHLQEAGTAWAGLVAERVVILIREPMGGFWTDDDVMDSLNQRPNWWPIS